jgi:hypothetical protein
MFNIPGLRHSAKSTYEPACYSKSEFAERKNSIDTLWFIVRVSHARLFLLAILLITLWNLLEQLEKEFHQLVACPGLCLALHHFW